jgi:hypothetical protein
MTTEQIDVSPIERVLPKTLDSLFTRNRELARLYLATDAQIAAVSKIIPETDQIRGEISDWRIVVYEVTMPGKEAVHLHPLGDNASRGAGCKITSPIVGIDLASQLVVTHSGSIYRLVGPRGEGEPTLHQLLHVAAAQWEWGRGDLFGVLHVFY